MCAGQHMYEQRGIFPNHFSLRKKEYGYKKAGRPDKTSGTIA
jgi:hypothetical protein